MKSIKNILIICLLTLLIVNQSVAQSGSGSFFDILYALPKDGSSYIDSYLSPVVSRFGNDVTSGWYTTAKTHNTLGIDIDLSISSAFVPKIDNSFTFTNSPTSSLELANTNEASVPTIFGSDKDTPAMKIVDHNSTYGDVDIADINAPGGLNLKKHIGFAAVPLPILQIGVGLIKNTDLKIRYIPDFIPHVNFSYWGVGIMHDLTQWIPVIDKLPIDISLVAGYSKFSFDYPTNPDETNFNGSNQDLKGGASGFDIEAIVSKKIAVLTVLAGVGYSHAKSSFNVNGTYEIAYPPSPAWPAGYEAPNTTYTDPIAINSKTGGLKATLGIRLQFAVFFINGDYTLGKENVLNTGLGLTFR
jgi:Family of unknown function (DUF6588)